MHIVLFPFSLLNFIRIGLFSFKGLNGKEKIQTSIAQLLQFISLMDIYGKCLVIHKTFITKITEPVWADAAPYLIYALDMLFIRGLW